MRQARMKQGRLGHATVGESMLARVQYCVLALASVSRGKQARVGQGELERVTVTLGKAMQLGGLGLVAID